MIKEAVKGGTVVITTLKMMSDCLNNKVTYKMVY